MHFSALSRQLEEGLLIENDKSDHLLNSKQEFGRNNVVTQQTRFDGKVQSTLQSETPSASAMSENTSETVQTVQESPRRKKARVQVVNCTPQSARECNRESAKKSQSQCKQNSAQKSTLSRIEKERRVQRERMLNWLKSRQESTSVQSEIE